MAPTSALTIEDLVSNDSLGLSVVVPGDLAAQVRGAHTMEMDKPARWLEPGWLMLTTGLRFLGDADSQAQADLVHELKEAGVVGLAFGVDVHFRDVPEPLVEAAREAGFTVLAVASEIPFLQVESFVNRSLASAETYLAKRALWLQNDLLQALSAEHPLQSLVNRVGQLIKGSAIVYDEAGTVIASTGAGPARLIWAEVQAREARRQRFTVGRWHVVTRPAVFGGMGYWIIVASLRESVVIDVADPILDSTQRLLGAIRGAQALQATQARSEARELLAALRTVVEPADGPRLWERLRRFRFRQQGPIRAFVSVALPNGASGSDAESAIDALAEEAQGNGLPLIFQPREPGEPAGLLGLAADHAALHEWIELLSATHHVGVSEPFTELELARRSFRDARRATLVAQYRTNQRISLSLNASGDPAPTSSRSSAHGTVVRFEDVDLATWLMSSRSPEAIHEKTKQQLGDLLDRSDLAETAVAYLASGFDVQATASRLFLHPNSVRYRLRKIEEIVAAPLTTPAVLANLYLAFYERLAAEDAGFGSAHAQAEDGVSRDPEGRG